jgi:hypothetical protein
MRDQDKERWPMSEQKSEMKFNLSEKASLFKELEERPPDWWNTLAKDEQLYIDIRKPAYINVYYRGGSLMRLTYAEEFKASISPEYIPLNVESTPVRYTFAGDEIRFNGVGLAPIGRFSREWLRKVKKRMGLFYPSQSENAIKAQYRLRNHRFIDTEFHVRSDARIDLVWLELPERKLYFVELKTIDDGRVYWDQETQPEGENRPDEEKIHRQLEKYHTLLKAHAPKIEEHYQKLYRIKKRLGLLPEELQNAENTPDFTIETKPIFLVGDCTAKWIDKYAEKLNERIGHCAYGAIYHGPNTTTFSIPTRDKGHEFIFNH